MRQFCSFPAVLGQGQGRSQAGAYAVAVVAAFRSAGKLANGC